MNEQTQPTPAQPAGEAEEEMVPPSDTLSVFFEALTTAVGVETVFGEPVTVGDRVIIPVAETSMGGGLGFGRGPGDGQGQGRPFRMGFGGGGGGGASTRPVAAIVVTPEEVRVQPIVDAGKLALAGISSAAASWKGIARFVKVVRKR